MFEVPTRTYFGCAFGARGSSGVPMSLTIDPEKLALPNVAEVIAAAKAVCYR